MKNICRNTINNNLVINNNTLCVIRVVMGLNRQV